MERKWVHPIIGKATDTACYRKSIDFDSNSICPLSYSKGGDDFFDVVATDVFYSVKLNHAVRKAM
ncbi:hypothetical protein F441_22505 [Phytophthora nicotianae CJ01A1]|uniref:Uncharacterized protein n=3 Tax=Phytophthora nicotianae TaxID=4792 RepID=W2PBG1_PHYN3|nr:hypothetical protein PPTG_24761 [Phytophthora nicotianae INRA-310]ETI48918.1 hypothetical protein F443_07110 [Phytophthora nicotianae P1569]ETM98005.1 hypothetical protein PPTG_24761 [Phytophthora nicotianae INRA-310]ETP00071.1 hypothetical protein F441_22505 [Phytophthora nicotianae CJ01A1]